MKTLEDNIQELKDLANSLDKLDDLKYHGVHRAATGVRLQIEQLEKDNGLYIGHNIRVENHDLSL